jgi:hypothetical protein
LFKAAFFNEEHDVVGRNLVAKIEALKTAVSDHGRRKPNDQLNKVSELQLARPELQETRRSYLCKRRAVGTQIWELEAEKKMEK